MIVSLSFIIICLINNVFINAIKDEFEKLFLCDNCVFTKCFINYDRPGRKKKYSIDKNKNVWIIILILIHNYYRHSDRYLVNYNIIIMFNIIFVKSRKFPSNYLMKNTRESFFLFSTQDGNRTRVTQPRRRPSSHRSWRRRRDRPVVCPSLNLGEEKKKKNMKNTTTAVHLWYTSQMHIS